jgi:hypothetical protein
MPIPEAVTSFASHCIEKKVRGDSSTETQRNAKVVKIRQGE